MRFLHLFSTLIVCFVLLGLAAVDAEAGCGLGSRRAARGRVGLFAARRNVSMSYSYQSSMSYGAPQGCGPQGCAPNCPAGVCPAK